MNENRNDKHFEWLPAQRARLEEYGVAETADVHCHVLPGMDDGPADMSQATALCAELADDGITTVVATPHQLGRYDRRNSAAAVAEKIGQLEQVLEAEHIPLRLLPGGDVRIDERLPKLLDEQEVISLGGANCHLLIELPHELLVDPVPTIESLCERGLQPILTHPERHPYLANRVDLLQDWVRRGAVIQLTAGSILGDFGRRAHRQTWEILELGLASIVATDAHDVSRRPPRMSAAIKMLSSELGAAVARYLCIDSPLRVVRGERVVPMSKLAADV